MVGNENLDDDINKDSIFGFYVDAGLATIVGVATRDAYDEFCKEWYAKNPDKNIYDDFFAAEFKKNYEQNPKFQRNGGDWINYKIGELSVPMIQSGYGDGQYPVYFGVGEDGEICEVVAEYICLAGLV